MLIVLIVNRHLIWETDAGIGFNKDLYIYRILYMGYLIGLQVDESLNILQSAKAATSDDAFRIILR